MELIIIRHGQAKHNAGGAREHVFAGRKVDNPLTEEGIRTVKKLADKLSKMGTAELIVSSSLKRSKQTAEIISRKLKVPVLSFRELDEFDVGKFAGHTEEEVKELYPVQASAFYQGDIAHWSFPGGENYKSLRSRLEKFVARLKADPKSRIIVCGHGGVNRVLFYLYANNQKSLWQKREYPHERIDIINLT